MAAALDLQPVRVGDTGEKDSHALGVAAIRERIRPRPRSHVYLSASCVYHPHAAAHLHYELASCWVLISQIGYFMASGKAPIFFYLALVFMTSEDPYRCFKDRLSFIGFMNNKIKLRSPVYLGPGALRIELGISEMHMMREARCRESPE